jgi:hypothetical protein
MYAYVYACFNRYKDFNKKNMKGENECEKDMKIDRHIFEYVLMIGMRG